MVNPNYTPGIGGLATSRYDFQAHITGENFRHNADQIDVNPAVIIDGVPYITVAAALYAIGNYITMALGNGEGFVTVGDGYNTYHNANGSINFDPTIPSLDTLLNPLFQMIANAQAVLANNTLPFPSAPTTVPLQYARIQYGGIIVIKAGTYTVESMISVPPGITLLGEGYGTKIINTTGLNTDVALGIAPSPASNGALASPSPLVVTNATDTNPIQITTSTAHGLSTGMYVSVINVNGNTNANTYLNQITIVDTHNFTLNGVPGNAAFISSPSAQVIINNPVFFILPDNNRNDNDTKVDPTAGNIFMFSRETKIMNLVIADNFIEPTILGDTNYIIPQNLTNSTFGTVAFPLIYQQNGSNLVLDGVYAMGRVKFSAGTTVSSVTAGLIETFIFPIIPVAIRGANTTTGSILKINNCFIDGFAVPFTFNGLNNNKDFVNISNSKIRAYGYLGGNSSSNQDNTFLLTSVANINIVNNHFYGNDINISSIFDVYQFSGSPPNLQQKTKITYASNNVSIANIATSNNANNTNFRFYVSDAGPLGPQASVSGALSSSPTIISEDTPYSLSSPYTVDDSICYEPYTNILLVDSADVAWQIILPSLDTMSVGVEKSITIKDYQGNADINNITVTSTDGIMEGLPVTTIAAGSNGTVLGTTVTAGSNGAVLSATPISINVVSTVGFATSGTFTISNLTGGLVAFVTYTGGGGGGTVFTGCTATSGTIFTNYMVSPLISTINVISTTGFPASNGSFTVLTSSGLQTIFYLSVGSSTTFSNCSGGIGMLATGNVLNPKILQTKFGSWTFVSINDGTTSGWFLI